MIYRVVFYELENFKELVDNLLLDGYVKSSTEDKATWYEIYEKEVWFMANAITLLGIKLLSLAISMIYNAGIVALGIIIAYKILF